MGVKYKASAIEAHSTVADLHADGVFHVIQGFHYWGSAFLIVHSLFQIVATILVGRYGDQDKFGVIAALLMVGVSLGFQMTGNLLPFDHHGVQTAAIEYGITMRAPVVGSVIGDVIFGGKGVSDGTLPQWYAFHRLLPFGVLFVGWLCWLWIRGGGYNYFKPIILLPALLSLLLAIMVPSPFGSAASPADYAAFDAHASWYTWPLHGALSLFDKFHAGWVGAMLIPGLIVLALFASAFTKPDALWPKIVVIAASLFFAFCGLFFGGSFAPLVGTRDPAVVTETVPRESNVVPINSALAATGRTLFNQQCSVCHGTDGKNGEAGPSLENVYKKHPDADFFQRYIKDPKSIKSSSTMPAFPDLKPDELKSLAEYLRGPH